MRINYSYFLSLSKLKIRIFDSLSKFDVDSSRRSMSILFNKTLINDSFCICPEDKDLFETTSYKSTSLSLNLNLF